MFAVALCPTSHHAVSVSTSHPWSVMHSTFALALSDATKLATCIDLDKLETSALHLLCDFMIRKSVKVVAASL
jgi:hypothetical protein